MKFNPLVPVARRGWDACVRVCQTCGEHHIVGEPTPSGRPCSGPVKVTAYRNVIRLENVEPRKPKKIPAKKEPKDPNRDRTCTVCKETKPRVAFTGNYFLMCTVCRGVKDIERKQKRLDVIKKWKEKNPEKAKAHRSKYARKLRGVI